MRTRYAFLLGRVSAAAVRGQQEPIEARLDVATQLSEYLGYPGYETLTRRHTDDVGAGLWWPGSDPALGALSEAEVHDLAGMSSAFFVNLLSCEGPEPSPATQARFKECLQLGYAEEHQSGIVGALVRYVDQLFSLLGSEVQAAESTLPLFERGVEVMNAQFSEEDRAAMLAYFEQAGNWMVQADSPQQAREMLGRMVAYFRENTVGGLDQGDWDILCMGMVAAFFIIAAADGSISDKEKRALGTALHPLCQGEATHLAVQVAQRTIQELPRIFPMAIQNRPKLPEFIKVALQLVHERFGEKEGNYYGASLLDIAKHTATADGKSFMGIGSKIDPKERKLLDLLSSLVGIPWE
jgi:tellurite resistance protein